ncbi:MAG: hypothetical protein VXW26_06615, partial [SAR324 cluster bacterium]|nr:hypothetical protein [SAR324 cluster bacterium]
QLISAGNLSNNRLSTDHATGILPRFGLAQLDPNAETTMRGVSPSFVLKCSNFDIEEILWNKKEKIRTRT